MLLHVGLLGLMMHAYWLYNQIADSKPNIYTDQAQYSETY